MMPLFLVMTSCASSTKNSPNINDINIDTALLTECEDIPNITSGKKKDVILYIFDLKASYYSCKSKHKALSQTVSGLIYEN